MRRVNKHFSIENNAKFLVDFLSCTLELFVKRRLCYRWERVEKYNLIQSDPLSVKPHRNPHTTGRLIDCSYLICTGIREQSLFLAGSGVVQIWESSAINICPPPPWNSHTTFLPLPSIGSSALTDRRGANTITSKCTCHGSNVCIRRHAKMTYHIRHIGKSSALQAPVVEPMWYLC